MLSGGLSLTNGIKSSIIIYYSFTEGSCFMPLLFPGAFTSGRTKELLVTG